MRINASQCLVVGARAFKATLCDVDIKARKHFRHAFGQPGAHHAADQHAAEVSFPLWTTRVEKWKMQLELIDIERTLDDRLILYVLNDRSAETTRLALLAAAGGFGVIHVQPVSAEGVVQASGGGGCGSCSK